MKGTQHKLKEKQYIYNWLGTNPETRRSMGLPTTIKALCKQEGIVVQTFVRWRDEYRLKAPIVTENSNPDEFNTVEFLRNSNREVTQALLTKIKSGKFAARDIELYYKMIGELKEEGQKPKGGLDGATIAVQVRNYIDQRREGDRVVEVQGRPDLLHQPVREDTGQGGVKDNPVQTVGFPEKDGFNNTV